MARCTSDTDERGSAPNPAIRGVWASVHEGPVRDLHLVDAPVEETQLTADAAWVTR